MANTVNQLSLANTFTDWLSSTIQLVTENFNLGKGNYTKDTGILTMNTAVTTVINGPANFGGTVSMSQSVPATNVMSIAGDTTFGGNTFISGNTSVIGTVGATGLKTTTLSSVTSNTGTTTATSVSANNVSTNYLNVSQANTTVALISKMDLYNQANVNTLYANNEVIGTTNVVGTAKINNETVNN
jgi:hypothetical protein